jgi:hypothetical protein
MTVAHGQTALYDDVMVLLLLLMMMMMMLIKMIISSNSNNNYPHGAEPTVFQLVKIFRVIYGARKFILRL